MPVPPKPASKRQNRGTKRDEIHLEANAVVVVGDSPAPPSGLDARWLAAWSDYWSHPIAGTTDRAAKLPAVSRLFQLYAARDIHFAEYMKAPLHEDRVGGYKLNPLARQLNAMESQILQLEDRLGLNPRAQLTMGVTWAQGQSQLADLAKKTAEEPDAKPRKAAGDPRKLLRIR